MKVIHIESGLGNQMLSYCELLAIKKTWPEETCLLETIVYDLPECNDVICQWNGFELDRIFHIHTPNVRTLFSDEQWEALMADIRQSQFWLKNWNYPVYFTEAFRRAGMPLENLRGDFEAPGQTRKTTTGDAWYRSTAAFRYLNFLRHRYLKPIPTPLTDHRHELFDIPAGDVFTGQKLLFKYVNSGIEQIADDIRQVFRFPDITDERNRKAMEEINAVDSVAIHARRGDMTGYNYDCYAGGYFRRAVSFIREHVRQPVFYIFCDPESIRWARSHGGTLGLDFRRDTVRFVNWNSGDDSWRDMQLMAACHHQVITRSSFGWWGAWLNTHPDKITCSPDRNINTTHHF